MRILATFSLLLALAVLSGSFAAAQDLPNQRAMPGNDAPAGPYILYWGPPSAAPPSGQPQNQWRYVLRDGRWWYWTADKSWSYYTGDTWVPYTSQSDYYLSRAPKLGPISGSLIGQGVWTRGRLAGLTMIPGDHAAAPHLRRGTVLPRYLKQQELPTGEEE